MSKTYIATQPLFVGMARAHNPGDEVPAANVEANGWQDGVAAAGSKAAANAAGDAAENPLSVSAQSPPLP